MRVTVKPWTWRDDNGRVHGALTATQLSPSERKIAFIPASKLYEVADALVDIAESTEQDTTHE